MASGANHPAGGLEHHPGGHVALLALCAERCRSHCRNVHDAVHRHQCPSLSLTPPLHHQGVPATLLFSSFLIHENVAHKILDVVILLNGASMACVQASIECGLAEAMKGRGVPYPSEDKERLLPWTLELTELYSMLPSEILDPSFQQVTQKVTLEFNQKQNSSHHQLMFASSLISLWNI